MARVRTMLSQKVFQEHEAWKLVHNKDHRAFLESMTIAELQNRANVLGLKDEYLSEYGHMQYKSTYISAIRMAHVLTQKADTDKASETGFVDDEAFQRLEMEHSHLKKTSHNLEVENDKLICAVDVHLATIKELKQQAFKREKDLFQARSMTKKRKRERIQDKGRILFELKQMYKRLKGDKIWTYDRTYEVTGPELEAVLQEHD